jgi:uncharacterized BrkB/YihY/UPF0761 family membrane protein
MIRIPFWDQFSDSWFRTRKAAGLFFISSLLVIGCTISDLLWSPADINSLSFWQRLPWGILGVTLPVAAFFLLIGMWKYWMRVDDSRARVKRLWFVILLVGICWGSCLYCYCVYLPQVARERENSR